MALTDRIKAMGFMPDIGKLQGMFDEKFNALLAELQAMHGVLDAMHGVLDAILAELQKGPSQ